MHGIHVLTQSQLGGCIQTAAAVEWRVSDPFSRKTYLHEAPGRLIGVRFSLGARTRALQLQRFLEGLEAAAPAGAAEAPGAAPKLVVLVQADWRSLLSAPYGWGLARRTPEGVVLALPAGYPARLLARWDAVRLRAAQAGVVAPGGVQAFLDSQLGLEWAHARLLSRAQGRAPRAWRREVAAGYLYGAGLAALGDTARLMYLEAWARLSQAGAQPGAETLAAFSYPRAKQPFDDLIWTQSGLWLRAAVLAREHGWALSGNDVYARLQEEEQAALRIA